MHRRKFIAVAATLAITTLGGLGRALANETMKVTGPFAHENLAVYFVHGDSAAGPVPLTLAEALTKGTAQVYETGTVSELSVENSGDEAVFIQAGDIVKGGQQDRVLTISLLLQPKSGRVPIASFCVEQGRWSARGREDVARFASATEALPSRAAKLAMKEAVSGVPRPAEMVQRRTVGSETALVGGDGRAIEQRRPASTPSRDGQSEIWSRVAETQRKLSENLKSAVTSSQSASSLQLTLEHQKVQEARAAYADALKAKGESGDDVVGVIVAINGRLNSAELYPSNGLFRKMWGKVLTAASTEALGERAAPNGPPPAASLAREFLTEAEAGKAQLRDLPAKAKLETRSTEKSLFSAAFSPVGQVIHRSYLAR
jgi:hypothetical protein